MTLKIGPESLKRVILAFPDDVAMHWEKFTHLITSMMRTICHTDAPADDGIRTEVNKYSLSSLVGDMIAHN